MTDAQQEIYTSLEEFEQACNDVADKSPVERLQAEADAFETLTDTLAEIYAETPDATPDIGRAAHVVADVSQSLTKTDARQEIADKSQKARNDGTDRTPLDEWVKENLEEVRVVRSTDHAENTVYVWDFGPVATIETEGGEEGRGHYSWINFRDSIDEAGGPYLADPNDPYTDSVEWREWIVTQRERNETRKTHVGPRTNATQALQDRVRRTDAFGSLSEAVNYDGVYVELADESERPDDAPEPDGDGFDRDAETPQELPEWAVDAIYFPNNWATDVTEEYNISPQALQNEIDARGYMLPGQGKIATREYVDGQYVTFWVVDGDFETPAGYQPEGTATDHSGVDALEADEKDSDDDFGGIGGS